MKRTVSTPPSFQAVPLKKLPEFRRTRRREASVALSGAVQDLVSIIKNLQVQLTESSKFAQTVVASTFEALLVISEDCVVLDANQKLADMLGVSLDTVIGGSVLDMFSSPNPELVASIFKNPNEGEYAISLYDKAKKIHVVEVRVTKQTSTYVIALNDITDRLESSTKVAMLSTALNQASDVIVITDKNNHIIFVNDAFTDHTGYTFEEAVGKDPGFMKSGLLPAYTYERMWAMLLSRETWQGHLINRTKDGNEVRDFTVITPIMNGDPERPSYYIAVKKVAHKDTSYERS